jgi:hypothetical protein
MSVPRVPLHQPQRQQLTPALVAQRWLSRTHGLRIERAKMLLEVTLHGVQGVAEACGYADAAALRRLFQREPHHGTAFALTAGLHFRGWPCRP